ncbi:TolC family outer membrane protein [Massilia cavernae]|uniref:Type I secretion protein TolC n=1 Tax=Massilia cavernae TaxID=2320864 RepID=A0A418Y813_9BURK|nr:TolC family outer membrane protein [Massilia cavernae]RJG27281.1 type I secretion protein TolC [Massilia cavernae]
MAPVKANATASRLRRGAWAIGTMLALQAGSAGAVSLQQAYEAALKNDPAYRMNFYENEAGKENRIIGRANLLPSLSGSYNANRIRADVTQQVGGNENLTHPRYISRSGVVQLRQPLVNFDAYARYRQGIAQTDESAARFESHKDEVAVRVVSAYLDALYARDQLNLVLAQRKAYSEQMKVNDRLFEKGEGTRTDMLETQARLDLAEAQVLEAQDNLTAARNTLEGVIGMDPGELDSLSASFRIDQLAPAEFDDWRRTALARNPDLQAARLAVDVAQQELNKARAGHAPRLDFVASYSKSDSETLTQLNQESLNRSVGIQLNVPIYSGGQVSAVSRQAVAARERAKADLDRRTSLVLVELRKAHSLMLSSVAKVDALVKAVNSGKLLVTATEQSIKGGVRINLDLLTAQQQLAATQRDLAQARYSYLIGTLRLRAAAGTLTGEDVMKVARFFE